MTLKHTPGPWTIIGDASFGDWLDIDGPDGITLANTIAFPEARGESNANARLISAAPDLLAALQSLLEVAGYLGIHESPYTDAASNARLAIRKATGE